MSTRQDGKGEIRSLNETGLARISIEELEQRLQMEELDQRGEMWTGCGCAEACAPEVKPPSWDCPSDIFCGYRGQW